MNRRKCTVKIPLKASSVDDPTFVRTFQPKETLWWDTSQITDPVIFEQDNMEFTAGRTAFLASVEVPK